MLSHVRLRQPTDDDIETLRSRIGVTLPNMESIAVTIRHHTLHQANISTLREEEAKSNTPYCLLHCKHHGLMKRKNIRLHDAYQIQFGYQQSPVDAILPLLPGVPLLITKI